MPNQAVRALRKGTRIRQWRAELKRDIHDGKVSPLEVLQSPAGYAENMKIEELLLAVYNLGPRTVEKALRRTNIRPDKPLGELTERQIWDLDARLSTQNAWCQSLAVE